MPPRKSTSNKIVIPKAKPFQKITKNMKKNNEIFFKKTKIKVVPAIMEYHQYLDEVMWKLSYEDNLLSTYVVRAETKERLLDDQKDAAM
jgi:hypothetical protein